MTRSPGKLASMSTLAEFGLILVQFDSVRRHKILILLLFIFARTKDSLTSRVQTKYRGHVAGDITIIPFSHLVELFTLLYWMTCNQGHLQACCSISSKVAKMIQSN